MGVLSPNKDTGPSCPSPAPSHASTLSCNSPVPGISRLATDSPARRAMSYSPLTTSSLYKLTTSPIIHTTIPEHPDAEDSEEKEQRPREKKRRVNKQLYA